MQSHDRQGVGGQRRITLALADVGVVGSLSLRFDGFRRECFYLRRLFHFVPLRGDIDEETGLAAPATVGHPMERFHNSVDETAMLGVTDVSPETSRAARHVIRFFLHAPDLLLPQSYSTPSLPQFAAKIGV